MFCTNCGNNIPDNSQFCPHCGKQFGAQGQSSYQGQPQYQAPLQVQPRTRLGITVGMLGAVVWFSALIDPVLVTLLAIYVLFVEKDKWLKGTAIKAVVSYFGFFFVFQVIDGINYALGAFTHFFNYWFGAGWSLGFPVMLTNILYIARIVLFIWSAFSAFKMKGFKIRRIDEFVENHM